MKKKIWELNEELIERLTEPINKTWQVIGCEIELATEEAGEVLTNYSAIECCLDANNLQTNGDDKEADEIVSDLCRRYDLEVVYKFLMKHFQLA